MGDKYLSALHSKEPMSIISVVEVLETVHKEVCFTLSCILIKVKSMRSVKQKLLYTPLKLVSIRCRCILNL
ncbi:hypothetical protein KSF78_0003912 [Schistosoma japonicum]|nr:hypothetical protein KSF78_0003912 [Schistosoma japonicum]